VFPFGKINKVHESMGKKKKLPFKENTGKEGPNATKIMKLCENMQKLGERKVGELSLM